jgi:predicted LPLAT superfamily acyltransferase/glycosyltransferase involved in cell wall biosynthesis
MIIRICVCIPSYNNEQTIQKVILDCLRQTSFPVLVVDDGSTRPILDELLDSACQEAVKNGRLRIVRHSSNQGKGVAIQTGIAEGVRAGFTHLLTIDGDGQHLISEVPKLVQATLDHPWDLIIGSRQLTGPTVPEISKFGRKFSNFWVNFQTGSHVLDSQSGFRIYPLFQVQNMIFWTKKFDFEIEILIRLLWKGVGVHDVDVQVYYPPAHERVSHFDKFWDNVRISCLNTLLVTLSLLKSNRSPRSTAFALGIGVWVGCTPFFGFHSLIVVGIALLFRLNVLPLWIGSHISLPPLAPLIVMGSITLGNQIYPLPIQPQSLGSFSDGSLHQVLQRAMQYFPQWWIGSIFLGLLLGCIAWGLSYWISIQLLKKNKKRSSWTGKNRGGVIGNSILKWVTRYLGLRAAYTCLFAIVPYFYIFAPTARKSANQYWKIMRPELGWVKRQIKVHEQLFRFGQVLLDRLYQKFYKSAQFKFTSHGREEGKKLLDSKPGLIMLTAHAGGWELASTVLGQEGFKDDFHVVHYQFQGQSRGDQLSVSSNMNQQPIFSIRDLLSQKKPIGLMGDRPLGSQIELVPFLGKLAPFDATPFRIAAICQASLFFTFCFKNQGMSYDLYAEPSRSYQYSPDQNKVVQCYEWTHQFSRHLESLLKKYPEQWFNFYPFWSALPSPPADVTASRVQNYLLEELQRPRK